MKKIVRKVLKEALGVPKDITKTAIDLYESILKEMRDNISPYDTDDEHDLSISKSFYVNDFEIDGIDFKINIAESTLTDKPDISAFAFGVGHSIDTNKGVRMRHEIKHGDTVKLMVNVVVPESKWKFQDIYDMFIEKRVKIIGSLTHELKHSYDYYKNPNRSVYNTGQYQAYSNTFLGLPPIDAFLYDLYFVHEIENLVRPSEIATDIELKGIKQKDFLKFIESDPVYKRLKSISNFSVENLKKSLKLFIPQIDAIFQKLNISTDISDDEKVELILKFAYFTIVNRKIESIINILQTTVFEKIRGELNPDKVDYYNKLHDRVQRFSSYKEFYEYEEKMFRYTAKKLMKKISKLYAITKTDESSILDWELHHKTNKNTVRGFVKEVNYSKKKK